MVFSSPIFLFYFLPVVLALHLMTRDVECRNRVLLAASLFFYAWGEPIFIFVLVGSAFIAYLAGRAMEMGHHRRLVLTCAILWHLGMLVLVKYWDFLVTELGGAALGLPALGFALPLGVSFFTFQSISYLVDVYRGQAPVVRRFDVLLLYISMFPQLIAGPIVRYRTVAGQLARRATQPSRSSVGVGVFVMGLAQKTLLANPMGQVADAAFGMDTAALDASEAWLGLAAYSLQIYYDFAGYSNMAIGLGLIFGFGFPRNFRDPYAARSITDFWRRWHMSLSRWFRDYLYIPLGGNRAGLWRTYANLMIVFLLVGLWHGAAWSFIVWGAWHGAFLVMERGVGPQAGIPRPVRQLYAILIVCLGWVWFRATDLDHALAYFAALAGQSGNGFMATEIRLLLTPSFALAALVATALAVTLREQRIAALRALTRPLPSIQVLQATPARLVGRFCVAALFALSLLSVAASAYNPFLYFRF